MKRKAFLPMWDSPKPKMTTSATLGLGKNCPHNWFNCLLWALKKQLKHLHNYLQIN